MIGKVFNIGLSKTGTTTIQHALNELGYTCAHHEEHFRDQRGLGTWFDGDFKTDTLVGYDAAADLPIPAFFAQLDRRYPGSKFILTLRDINTWLVSVSRHWKHFPLREDAWSEYRKILRLSTYGIYGFSVARMRYVYHCHLRNVKAYFAKRQADLLIMSVFDGDGWDKLCPFLGKSIPAVPFPWKNRTAPGS